MRPTGMGQEAGKPAWPKTAGGYQTISGRRYGRRHAYVSFRPFTEKQRPASTADCQNVEMNSARKDQAMGMYQMIMEPNESTQQSLFL